MTRFELWRARLWSWLPPLLIVVAALGLLSAYRLLYSGRVEAIGARLADREQHLATVSARRRQLEERVARVAARDAAVADLYARRFATERERLTAFLQEIRTLGRRAGLEPRAVSYPANAITDYDLVEREVVFSVEGSYEELRRFINLLELSDQFVTLQQVSLAEVAGNRLRIQLRLATVFVRDPGDVGPAPETPPDAAATEPPATQDAVASPAVAEEGA